MNFAYYCSGHGYGHATRVSALSAQLLTITPKPTVYIISSAPAHCFADSIKLGALYRNASVDPVIQQPLAYRIDRKKSMEVLRAFLSTREALVLKECQWMKENNIHCVLSDAVFIACAAANMACLPSALVTNFSFDSIWSYLSAPLIEPPTPVIGALQPGSQSSLDIPAIELEPDEPIPLEELAPLAERIAQDYRNADLLLRLPGYIPFPSFSPALPLPATGWVNPKSQRFHPSALSALLQPVESLPLYPSTPFPQGGPQKPIGRLVKDAPLLVRHPSPDIYSPEARRRILDSIGVPTELQDPNTTKVLIVSFGGQVIKRPTHSRNTSRSLSTANTPLKKPIELPSPPFELDVGVIQTKLAAAGRKDSGSSDKKPPSPGPIETSYQAPRVATPSHLYIPGAPPASNPSSPIIQTSRSGYFRSIMGDVISDSSEEYEPRLLPDGWIAIVCGVAKNWGEEDLPEGFYVAPKDIYMPDLTAVGDVLLGKLGYGTCAECVDACTPFVYVPRPFFVEEHGLRVLMEDQGVGVLLPQESYEEGDWAVKVEEAYEKGRFMKAMKRKFGWDDSRKQEANVMANDLVGWVNDWWTAITSSRSGEVRSDLGAELRDSVAGGHVQVISEHVERRLGPGGNLIVV